MKILILTNLYPPNHAGTFDSRCESVTNSLRLRGHQMLVLTSTHGMRDEQRDGEIERRLHLNGVFGHPLLTKFNDLKPLEVHNSSVVSEVVERFQPDVIHVFSLQGLSKSLVFTLRNTKLPVVYDVADHWLSAGVREDPWLRFWNAPSLSFLESSTRTALEMSGERGRLDSTAPTRMRKGYERLPSLYGDAKTMATVEPNSIPSFRFDRIYFCSQTLKQLTETVGFVVSHGEVIYPGIQTQQFIGELKPASAPMTKFLIVSKLDKDSGVMTALEALRQVRAIKLNVTLSIYGRGDSNYIAELRSFVVRNQLPVEFLNVSNLNQDMPSVYRKHDALLYTPEWSEPFPVTPLEAMACGLPVIGSRAGGANELLRHGENALAYMAGNAAELAARIQELKMQPALRCQMIETAQAEVLSKYNDSAVTDQIENYLNTSLESWAHTAT
ncbi:MAG: glycosyltransferase family 4 protein [Verrucomicrobiota bacterium]